MEPHMAYEEVLFKLRLALEDTAARCESLEREVGRLSRELTLARQSADVVVDSFAAGEPDSAIRLRAAVTECELWRGLADDLYLMLDGRQHRAEAWWYTPEYHQRRYEVLARYEQNANPATPPHRFKSG